ncbi:MAG: DUF554 domain-containing protein [Chloroflexi bacterium]|nr:DUF554 domain-containing protein [Chloroflexota bacterium]
MTGTILNVITILIGGGLGLLFGSRVPEKLKQTVVAGMGLFTAAMGLQMFFKSSNQLIVLGSLLIGTLVGEWLRIEDGIQALGRFLEARFASGPSAGEAAPAGTNSRFVRGFLTASLLFCIGPMAILGSINDGLRGDYSLLAVKSVLDGFASLAFASTLGIGVLFSSLPVFVYQGGISLMGGALSAILTDAMIAEMTATGGVILAGLALSSLLEIKPIRVGNFLPSLAIAPLIVWVLTQLKIM